MGVDLRVVRWLRQQGHDAVHRRDEGLQRAPDEAIFAKALREDRSVLTFDLDFGSLAALVRDQAARVILFRLHNARASRVIERLEGVLVASASELDRGAVVLVEETRHRVRRLPVGEEDA